MAASDSDRLWAPWRMRYVGTAHRAGKCLFCAVRAAKADRPHLVLARRPGAVLMLNRYPYTPAHLMVAVTRHVPRFADLSAEERQDLLDLTALAELALAAEYRPHGVNYGLNSGRVAGAGFPGHLHMHLVARWDGDTNFMTTVAGTRVLPESLSRTWMRMRRALKAVVTASNRPRQRRSRGR